MIDADAARAAAGRPINSTYNQLPCTKPGDQTNEDGMNPWTRIIL